MKKPLILFIIITLFYACNTEQKISLTKLDLQKIISIFEDKNSVLNNTELNKSLIKKEIEYDGMRIDADYKVSIFELQLELECEVVEGYNFSFKLTPNDDKDGIGLFNLIFEELTKQNDKYSFSSALVGKYEQGTSKKLQPKTIGEYEKLKEYMVKEADLKKDFIRIGFLKGETAIEINIDKGKTVLFVRSIVFRDTYKWFHTLIAEDIDDLISKYYFTIKSVGMIPPNHQIVIIKGRNKHNKDFNLVFFAPPEGKIEKIEASFIEQEKAKEYWLQLMEDKDLEKDFGVFENTVLLPNKQNAPVVLNTLKETIEWVKQNPLDSVAAVMPIFRVNHKRVNVPQLSHTSGLIVNMAVLEKNK
ncbi:MAG: hypothetical protein Q4A56_00705 [Porphyromonadaceae bacterium]|nr:hypothetical protein [Porphyromonadaceae bacterium]